MSETKTEQSKPQAESTTSPVADWVREPGPALTIADQLHELENIQRSIARLPPSLRPELMRGVATATRSTRLLMGEENPPLDDELAQDDLAQHAMYQDIDAILARVETGIAAERAALDALLERLSSKAAA